MFFIGIGSAEAAKEFADNLNIDATICFADQDGKIGDELALEQGLKTMWNPPAVDQMMGRNDEDSLKELGESFKKAVDNIGFKKLAPEQMKDTLRQGGTFIFRGNKLIFEHYDEKVGDNCSIDSILQVL